MCTRSIQVKNWPLLAMARNGVRGPAHRDDEEGVPGLKYIGKACEAALIRISRMRKAYYWVVRYTVRATAL